MMAVVGGGAQAELAVVHERAAMPVPEPLEWPQAGGLPEVFTTAHDALCTQADLRPGEHLLVHGAAGGVGTAAVQLGRMTGARVTATVRREELRAQVEELGARAIDPEGFEDEGPFDVVLELVGASNLAGNLRALATRGRIAVIGVGGTGPQGEINLLAADAEARPHPRLHAARAPAGAEGGGGAAGGEGGPARLRRTASSPCRWPRRSSSTGSRTPTRASRPAASSARSCSCRRPGHAADVCPIGICPMGTAPRSVDNSLQTEQGKPVARRGRKARGLSRDGGGGSAAGSNFQQEDESRMAELTIVFRLRFAVALSAALCLLLVLRRARRMGGRRVHRPDGRRAPPPRRGSRSSRRSAARVTTPELPVINGFGAVLEDDAAEELSTVPGVKAVTLNAPTDNGTDASSTSLSGGTRCPVDERDHASQLLRGPERLGRLPAQRASGACASRCSTRFAQPTRGSAAPPAAAWAWQ